MNGGDRPRILASLAAEIGSHAIAVEAQLLAERVAGARFYVACVGQFKRGKSTLLNALVGAAVLPTGVVPVTAAVTVMRYGAALAARVRLGERDWEDCDPRNLGVYVSEDQNPGNEKGVSAVEVFVPSPLLERGMCLVDTPGIGSISEANTVATRAFVPHIDAALVVLGADPPISGEELALVQDVARGVAELIFVFSKADRTSDPERAEAIRFTERVLAERLGRAPGRIYQVSATDRLNAEGPARDWDALVDHLGALARGAGAELVANAESRGSTAIIDRLLRELDEQEQALVRPIGETQARVEKLGRIITEAEQSLDDLGHRLLAVQERLSRTFDEERDRFFAAALSDTVRELGESIHADSHIRDLRPRAADHALEAAKRSLERWRAEQERHAATRYREGVQRFADLLNDFQVSLGSAGVVLPAVEPDTDFRAQSHVFYTGMFTIAPASDTSRLLDLLRPRAWRIRAVERDAAGYLERLLEVNSARIKNDFRDRVDESRRLLAQEIRERLRELRASAERALETAREAQAAGAAAVESKLATIASLRSRLEAGRFGPPSTAEVEV